MDSSSVKAQSLLHVSDIFSYKPVPDLPIPNPHPGPLVPAARERLLASHPDKLYACTVLQIVQYGARIGYTEPDQLIPGTNLPSGKYSRDSLDKERHQPNINYSRGRLKYHQSLREVQKTLEAPRASEREP